MTNIKPQSNIFENDRDIILCIIKNLSVNSVPSVRNLFYIIFQNFKPSSAALFRVELEGCDASLAYAGRDFTAVVGPCFYD